MLEFLSPRRVAARKLARQIAQKRFPTAKPGGLELSAPSTKPGTLEALLEEELGKYDIRLVQ